MRLSKTAGGIMLGAALSMALPVGAQAATSSALAVSPNNGAHLLNGSAIQGAQWSAQTETAEHHRRFRRSRRGFRGFRGRRHRRGIRGGDILAGALIIGGIAAIASASSSKSRRRDYEVDRRVDRRDRRSNARSDELSFAADQCASAAEESAGRNARVERLTNVQRDGNGWRVDGQIVVGDRLEGFSCGVSNGQVDFLQFAEAEQL